jgi:DUF971 family protein
VNDIQIFGRKHAGEDALRVLVDVAHDTIVPWVGRMSSRVERNNLFDNLSKGLASSGGCGRMWA